MLRVPGAMVGSNTFPPPVIANRDRGLDALRGGGAFLVVVLHAAIPYLQHPLQGLAWPARSSTSSSLADGLFWWIESFIMPLFFCLSGYGCWQSLKNRSAVEFMRSRLKRLGRPFLAGCVIILPIEMYLWIGGWVLSGELPAVKLRSLKLTGDYAQLWGFSHLWYLQYLLLMSLPLALWKIQPWISSPERSSEAAAVLSISRKNPGTLRAILCGLAFLGIVSLTLTWRPDVVTGFQHGFLPDPAKFAYSAEFFLLGITLAALGQPRFLDHPAVLGFSLLTAIAALIAVYQLTHAPQMLNSANETWTSPHRWLSGGLLASTAFFWTLTCWVMATKLPPLSPLVFRLAKASFWIYLVHHPLIVALEIGAVRTSLPATIQFVIVAGIGFALSWWSYHAWIEGSLADRLLHGQSLRRSPDQFTSSGNRERTAQAA